MFKFLQTIKMIFTYSFHSYYGNATWSHCQQDMRAAYLLCTLFT